MYSGIRFAEIPRDEDWFFRNKNSGASFEHKNPRNRFIAAPSEKSFGTRLETPLLKRFGSPGSAVFHGSPQQTPRPVPSPAPHAAIDYSKFLWVKSRIFFNKNV